MKEKKELISMMLQPSLKTKAEDHSWKQKITLSEYIRKAISKQVASDDRKEAKK